MTRRFSTTKPLQALKLTTVLGFPLVLLVGAYGLLPGDASWTILLLTPFIGVGLVFVVTAETLVTLYRTLRTDTSLTMSLTTRPTYSIIRTVEVAAVLLGIGSIIYVFATLPTPPEGDSGAAGVGLLFIIGGLTLVIFGGILIRTLAEYYYFRRSPDTRPDPA